MAPKKFDKHEKNNSDTVVLIVGCCLNMCPRSEILLRQRERLVHVLEKCPEGYSLVKEFSRSAAGVNCPTPDNLRPAHVLIKTCDYLLTKVLCRSDVPLRVVYEFVSDRLRCIRQDMTIQQIDGSDAAVIWEKCILFHVWAGAILCGLPLDDFDPHLNSMHLRNTLHLLMRLYDRQAHLTKKLYMELHIIHIMGELPKVTYGMDQTIARLGPSPAATISRHWMSMHFYAVCQSYKTLPLLLKWALHPHMPTIRRRGLYILNLAFGSANCSFPIHKLQYLLSLDSTEQTILLCKNSGVAVEGDNVLFKKGGFNNQNPPLHTPFNTSHPVQDFLKCFHKV